MRLIILLFLFIFIITRNVQAQLPDKQLASAHKKIRKGKIIDKDDFERSDRTHWIIEMAPQPNSSVSVKNGKLVLDTKGGVTVWRNLSFTGNIIIEYDRRVVMEGGINDRLSDLNQFWMASDPMNKNLFTRNGILENYDSLLLYYVGMGGNTNKTTRFRKYENGKRELLQEFSDSLHLLQANTVYHITTIIKDGVTSFWVNDQCYFIYRDPHPLTSGYFGFRSTKSRQEIDNFKVSAIK